MLTANRVAPRPSNPALSPQGRQWQQRTGLAPAGRRMLNASRGEQKSQVLAALGTNPNELTPNDTQQVLRRYPNDAVEPDIEQIREMEMAVVAAHGRLSNDDEYDDDDEDVGQTPLPNTMPAARTLSSLERREKQRITLALKNSNGGNVASARAQQIRKGKRSAEPVPDPAEEEEEVQFVPTPLTMQQQDEQISGPGGMLEHTNMIVSSAVAQQTEAQITRMKVVMQAVMATLTQRSHAAAQAQSGQRPHEVPKLRPDWMWFLTRYQHRPFLSCSNAADCFGMSLQPPPGMPNSPLIQFHTPAQWSNYLNTGQLPSDMCKLCVWCLALGYLSIINTHSNESTSTPLLQECMPFCNPVDEPGGYCNEFCYRPPQGARESLMPYAIRAPVANHFVPVMHSVKRPLLNERHMVRRDAHGQPECELFEVLGFAEIGDVLFRDGQDMALGGRRLLPEQAIHVEFQGVQFEYQLRTRVMCAPFIGSTSLRKTMEVVIQQDHPESDMSANSPLQFFEEDTYLVRLLDMTLRPLNGALRVAQQIGITNRWSGEEHWSSWAYRHGLVINRSGVAPDNLQPWDQLALAVSIGNHLQFNARNNMLPTVSNHLLAYMITARTGLLAALDEMLLSSSSSSDQAEMKNMYKADIRNQVECFSTGHIQAFELLLALAQHAKAIDDYSLVTKTPKDYGYSSFAEMLSALEMENDDFSLPSPDVTVENTWIELLQPVYADNRHSTASFAKYVRYVSTIVWRPNPLQWLAAHNTAVETDGAGVGGVCYDTHPPRALSSLLVDPTLKCRDADVVQLLGDAFKQAGVKYAQLTVDVGSFTENWALFNVKLPTNINTAHWTPRRMVHNLAMPRTNLDHFNEKTDEWNNSINQILHSPRNNYTVLLALVHTVNQALGALKTHSAILQRLRSYLEKINDRDSSEFVLRALGKEYINPANRQPATKAPAAGNARTRTSTQRASVSAAANDKANVEYKRVRELARQIAKTDAAQSFYRELDSHEKPKRDWQNNEQFVEPGAHEALMSRLAARLISPGGSSLNTPEHVFLPSASDLYRLKPVYDTDDIVGIPPYVSANSADPLRMPPHPSVLDDDETIDTDPTPSVNIAPLPLQSAFVSANAFRRRTNSWFDTIEKICNQAEAAHPDRHIHIVAPELFVVGRAIAHWQQLTHRLLLHAQSHFRLALLALDAPGMPDDNYFYQELPNLHNELFQRQYDDIYAMTMRNSVPRPTRFDFAEPMTHFSAGECYLPDATMLVASARLFETNAQSTNENRRNTGTDESAGGGGGGAGKKKNNARKNAPQTTTSYDVWMNFLSRVMPQATFIVHGLDKMVRGTDDPSFMMLLLRSLRASLLSGYEYAAAYETTVSSNGRSTATVGPLPFHIQLEFERLFVHAEDAAVLGDWSAQVFTVWREFINANDLLVLACAREFVLRMIDQVPSCEDNVRRVFRDYPAFRRWVRLCTMVIRNDIAVNNGTMVGIQRAREDSLKGRDPDKGWSVFHTDSLATFATEDFSTWIYERVVAILVQRATWRCVWGHVSEHCISRVPSEDAQRMVTYIEMIPPGQHYQRHWLRDLQFDAYTIELVHRMYVTYPHVDRRHANFYLYMLPPQTLTTLGLFFLLLSQHYINQVAPLPPAYARQQQVAMRRAFSIDDDDAPLPAHLIDVYVCSPLACYELLTPVSGRYNTPGRQSGVRENYETGELYCTSRHVQRNGSTVPYDKVLTLNEARNRYNSQTEAHKHGMCTDENLQRARNELVSAADGVARTVVNNMFVEPCASTPVLTRPGIGTVTQIIKKRKKRAMAPTNFSRCIQCGNNAVFGTTSFTTNGFLCQTCRERDELAARDHVCVVCSMNISQTFDGNFLRQHNRRIASERRVEKLRISDQYDTRNMKKMYDVHESFVSTDTTPHQVILYDDQTDQRPRVFYVCCRCWIRWMPDAQKYYMRSEFVHAARSRCTHPAEKYPVSFADAMAGMM